MPARVSIDNLVILDELESRMRRTAARVAALAEEKGGDARASVDNLAKLPVSLCEAVRALSPFVPELVPAADSLADVAADPSGADSSEDDAEEDLSGIDPETLTLKARALTGSGETLARARDIWSYISNERLGHTGAPTGEGGGTHPAAAAEWIGLSADLWAAEGDARYLDAIERAYYTGLLFAQTEDGAGVVGRTLEGEPGEADDVVATPALARGLATAGRHVLTTDAGGGLVSGMAANASAVLSVCQSPDDGKRRLRLIVQTQIPVRGWTSWVFKPLGETADSVPSSAVTRRTGRRQRASVMRAPSAPLASGEGRRDEGPATLTFRVRVPKWAASSAKRPDDDRGGRRTGPGVKIDGRPANVRPSDGFYLFEVPVDRETKIEVILDIGPWTLERKSSVSWGSELAVGYGPLLLTTLSQLNPGEDLSVPQKITSQAGELELVGDIRRRLPLVEARAPSRGGPAGHLGGCVLFAPVSEVGGFAGSPGGRRRVLCQGFRTWHRRGP